MYREKPEIKIPHLNSSTQDLRPVAVDSFEQFNALYKKYINGSTWLKEQAIRGNDVAQDLKDFTALVVKPMQETWLKLTDEEKKFFKSEEQAVGALDASIV